MQGYLKKQNNGRYGISETIELSCGTGVEVETPNGWIKMWVEHDGIDYYLDADGLYFYPKKIYARIR